MKWPFVTSKVNDKNQPVFQISEKLDKSKHGYANVGGTISL